MPGHTQGNVAAGAPGQPPYTSVPLESNRTPRPRSVGGASGTARRPLSRPAPAAHREIAANHCRAVPAHSHAGRSSAAQAPARASPPPAPEHSNLGVHAGLADRGRAAAAAGACAPTRRLQSATGEPQSHTASARRVANRPAPAHSTTAAATEPFASRRRRSHLTTPPPPQLTPPACALLRSKPRGMGGEGRGRLLPLLLRAAESTAQRMEQPPFFFLMAVTCARPTAHRSETLNGRGNTCLGCPASPLPEPARSVSYMIPLNDARDGGLDRETRPGKTRAMLPAG